MNITDYYFPSGSFTLNDDDWFEHHSQGWYAKHLASMQEPRLFNLADATSTVYRLLYLPTFAPPFIIRLNRGVDSYFITVKQTDGLGGYDAGQITADRTEALGQRKWDEVEREINDSGFWDMPTKIADSGLDGSQCIIEGCKSDHYHVVDRWYPREGSIKNLFDLFISLSTIDLFSRSAKAT